MGAIEQSGPVVGYRAAAFTIDGVVTDGGAPDTPALGAVGVFNGPNKPFAVHSQIVPGGGVAGARFAVVQTLETTTLVFEGYNGGADPRVFVQINGAVFPFPGGAPVTPEAGLANVIEEDGVFITVATGPISGGFVTNPPSAAAQGLDAAENAYIDLVNPPGSTDATGNGTTSILFPGGYFTLPALAPGVNVYVNAPTAGHLFTVVTYP